MYSHTGKLGRLRNVSDLPLALLQQLVTDDVRGASDPLAAIVTDDLTL